LYFSLKNNKIAYTLAWILGPAQSQMCLDAVCTQVHIKDTEHLGNFPDRQQQL